MKIMLTNKQSTVFCAWLMIGADLLVLTPLCVNFTVDMLREHFECKFKHQLPERMETSLTGAKVRSS